MVAPLLCTAALTWHQVVEGVRDKMVRDARVHAIALTDLLQRSERRAALFSGQLEIERGRAAASATGVRQPPTDQTLQQLANVTAAATDFLRGGRPVASNARQPLPVEQPLLAALLQRVSRPGEKGWGFPYQRDGHWMAPFARVLDDGLVVVVSADLAALQFLFDSAHLPAGFAMGVATAGDYRLWFRWPMRPELIGHSYADHPVVRDFHATGGAGITETAGGLLDPRRRLIAWDPGSPAGLVSVVGVPKVAILSEWAGSYGLALALMAGLTAVLGRLLWRFDQRTGEAVREALRNERTFEDYARASGDWHWEADAQGLVTRVSQSIQDIGLDPARVVGKSQQQFLRFVHDIDRSDWSVMRDRRQRHEPYRDMKFELLTPLGLRWISISGVPMFDEHGVFTGYRDVAHDATERVLAEQRAAQDLNRVSDRLRLALHAAGIGIWEWRLDGKRFWCDAAMLRLLGKAEAPNVQSAVDIRSTVHPDDSVALANARALTAAGRQPGHELEYRVIDPDGGVRYLFESATSERDADEAVTRMVGAVLDITTRRRVEQAERAQAAAELTNRAKSEMVSRVSHEFRTPLNAILGFSQLLELDPDLRRSPKAFEYVSAITAAGTHLLALVNDMLELAQIEANRLLLRMGPVALDEAVADAAFLTSTQAQQKRVTLVIDNPSLAARVVHADPLRLQQVLLNLLSNAVKYNHERGHVFVSAETGDERHPGRIGLRVTDNGVGIAADKLGALFRPFARISSTSAVEGAGLGLAISRQLVEAMGGQIEVSSAAGNGASFTVWLNPDAVPEDAAQVRIAAAAAQAQSQGRLQTQEQMQGQERVEVQGHSDTQTPLHEETTAQSRSQVPGDANGRVGSPAGSSSQSSSGIPPGPAIRAEAPPPVALPLLRVLYIEDNALNARLVAAALDDAEDLELTIVDNATEGIALARSLSFDLILLDLNLPDLDGISAMQEIRRSADRAPARPRQPIVAVSADASPDVIGNARAAGFDEFWTKPLDVRHLRQRLRDLADLHRAQPSAAA